MKTTIPKDAKSIVEFDDNYCGCTEIARCPHCGERSHYATVEVKERGGFTICPFCGGAMFKRECRVCVWYLPTVKYIRCLAFEGSFKDWKNHISPDPYFCCDEFVISRDFTSHYTILVFLKSIAAVIYVLMKLSAWDKVRGNRNIENSASHD